MAPRDSVNYSRFTLSYKVIDGALAQVSNFLSSGEPSIDTNKAVKVKELSACREILDREKTKVEELKEATV